MINEAFNPYEDHHVIAHTAPGHDGLRQSDGSLRHQGSAWVAAPGGADMDENGKVELGDYVHLAGQWLKSPFASTCGDAKNPWPEGDLNRDCLVDFKDLQTFAKEWLNDCDWLNWNCRCADLNTDGIVNFYDYAEFASGRR